MRIDKQREPVSLQEPSRVIPYARQSIDDADKKAVLEVLGSDWLTQGPAIETFERAAAEECGAKYAVAVSSATAALHVGCRALDLGPGDWLWTSPNTFVASANCGLYCGAQVDFVDIDPRTYNLSVDELSRKLERAAREGRVPKVVVPVHFAGQSCEMEQIAELAHRYRFRVIEDAAHAIGGSYKGQKIGGCANSDLTVFSFHPVKIITTGEGGMVVTNDRELYARMLRLRTHGVTRQADQMEKSAEGPWYYEQVEVGYNYRITDIQAALGTSQLTRIKMFVKRRRELAERYSKLLAALPLTLPWQNPDSRSAWHLYVIRVQEEKTGKSRREIFDQLRKAGIGVNVHYIPVHTQPIYKKMGFKPGMFPQAERYYEEAISLPMYFELSDEDQGRVVSTLSEILKR